MGVLGARLPYNEHSQTPVLLDGTCGDALGDKTVNCKSDMRKLYMTSPAPSLQTLHPKHHDQRPEALTDAKQG